MDLIDDVPTPQGNQPEYTVSELSGAVKRVIDMYHANIGADDVVENEWYEPHCDQMEIVDVREYDGDACYTLESTAEDES